MARKQFVVLYADKSKENIGCAEKETRLLAKEIKHKSGNLYVSTEQVKTYHAFPELKDLKITRPSISNPMRRFLEGAFVIEDADGRRYEERLETPESLEMNLPARIAQLEAVGA